MDDIFSSEGIICQQVLPVLLLDIELLNCLHISIFEVYLVRSELE